MHLRSFLKTWKKVSLLDLHIGVYPFSKYCPFEENYEKKKLERRSVKIQEIFNASIPKLVSHVAQMEILVPNFFTNQLILEQYPWKESPNKKNNFFENSYARFTLPLSSSLRLREKLNKLFDQEVRTGKIFELMDSMAGIVSYSHCFAPLTSSISNRDMICVTGSVESLHLFDKINISEDLLMEGYLNHVGKTSMEIEINVLQEGKLKANSLFTMVARDAKNPEKGYQVPQLSFDNLQKGEKQKALARHEAAKVNLVMRKEEMAASYDKTPPTPQEIKEIHDNFLSRKGRFDLSNSTVISDTRIESCQIMHTQQRNIHGKIFGGFLIKEMIEIAWVAGCKYAEDFVEMEELTNIYFKKPVEIGSRLTLKAMVTFAKGCRIVVTVEAYISSFKQKEETLACYLHLVAKSNRDPKKVHPESYEQTLQYLSSRKAFKELFY